MIVTINTTEEMITKWLQAQGVSCKIISHYNETVDGEIEIQPNVFIQVGMGYVCLVVDEEDDSFLTIYSGNRMKTLLIKLNKFRGGQHGEMTESS